MKPRFDEEVKIGNQLVEVSLTYDKAGVNPDIFSLSQRGYYLHIQPFEREGVWKKVQGYTGATTLLKPAKRFSETQFDKLWDIIDPNVEALAEAWVSGDKQFVMDWVETVRNRIN